MFGAAVRAELRKIGSTKVWWLLLIPVVLVSYLISIIGAAIAQLPDEETLRQLGGTFPSLLGVSLTYSVGFASLCSLCLGITAFAGEVRHRTITTTLLTTRGRGTVLAAKLLAYGLVSCSYGLALSVAATLGGLTAGGWSAFPPIGQFLAVALVGSLVVVLWTLLGVGCGALVPNQAIALVGALLTRLVVERTAGFALPRLGAQSVADVLPSSASATATSRLATDFAVQQAPLRTRANFEDFLPGGGMSWWLSGVVLALWVLVFCLAGWLVSSSRDVR